MEIKFYKYQGTGNDFIMIDNRSLSFPKNNTSYIARLCDRRFGIGADGLILLEDHPEFDFTMVYFNSDGNPSSMCGNGGRCITRFAESLGIIAEHATFEAVDGPHEATIQGDLVSLKMGDVSNITTTAEAVFLDTGSPHHVALVDNLDKWNVKEKGASIRYGMYHQEGANVNFVEPNGDNAFSVRTYERGVEDETLSCGTGVTAVAIAMHASGKTTSEVVRLHTPGGDLSVRFKKQGDLYTQVFLEGPAEMVYEGIWK